jgi:hypothetical protein
MTRILKQIVENRNGIKWVRTHAIGVEDEALCFSNTEYELEMEEGIGHITCVDCIAVIKLCKDINSDDLMPEYDNEMFMKRTEN